MLLHASAICEEKQSVVRIKDSLFLSVPAPVIELKNPQVFLSGIFIMLEKLENSLFSCNWKQ